MCVLVPRLRLGTHYRGLLPALLYAWPQTNTGGKASGYLRSQAEPEHYANYNSLPGSAWERTTRGLLPALLYAWPQTNSGGKASGYLRSQAEPGNEYYANFQRA